MSFADKLMNSMPSGAFSSKSKSKIPKRYEEGSLQQFTPEQMELFQQMFSQVSPDSYLSKLAGGDEEMFKEMEAPAWRQFQEAQGELGSRFSSMGMGAQKGSGFQNAANQQSSDFAMNLQSQRQGLQRQAIQDLFNMSQGLLGQKPEEKFLVEKQKKKSGWGGLIGAGIGGVGGFFAGGGSPATALSGASLGYKMGSSF